MSETRLPPVIGFTSYKGAGKTSLITKIMLLLHQRDIRIAVIKHASYDFDVDHPGKDSFELRKAKAYQTLISSGKRKALITEFENFQSEPSLDELIQDLDHENIDIILVEGFKREHFAKIELHRQALNKPYLHLDDPDIIALVTDAPPQQESNLAILDINNPDAVADFIFNLIY